eukprot:scaffold357_cov239-Pinguiococcus_pyrenoidosus.AAC.16
MLGADESEDDSAQLDAVALQVQQKLQRLALAGLVVPGLVVDLRQPPVLDSKLSRKVHRSPGEEAGVVEAIRDVVRNEDAFVFAEYANGVARSRHFPHRLVLLRIQKLAGLQAQIDEVEPAVRNGRPVNIALLRRRQIRDGGLLRHAVANSLLDHVFHGPRIGLGEFHNILVAQDAEVEEVLEAHGVAGLPPLLLPQIVVRLLKHRRDRNGRAVLLQLVLALQAALLVGVGAVIVVLALRVNALDHSLGWQRLGEANRERGLSARCGCKTPRLTMVHREVPYLVHVHDELEPDLR